MRAILAGSVVLLSITLIPGPAFSQSKYEFKPGSRQAVEVSPGSSGRTYTGMSPGSGVRRGGMHLRQPGAYSLPRGYQNQAPAAAGAAGSVSAVPAKKGPKSYSFREKIEIDGLTRTARIYVPASYSPGRAMPLVLIFHGLNMSADSMVAITGFNGIASRNGFIVAYCESARGRWADGMNNPRGVDDLGYVKKLITQLAGKLSLDRRRIYALGLSNGGYFAQMLACQMTDQIAAVAVVGSTAMSQALATCQSNKPVPAIFFFGTEDPLINWGDDRSRALGKYKDKLGAAAISPEFYALSRLGGWLTVHDTVAWWVDHNNCNKSPYSSYEPDRDPADGMRVKKEVYGSGGNQVLVYFIEGGEHSWPGALALPGVTRRICQDVEASELIWKFFSQNSR
ncbi:MAG: hypothetical protein IPM23_20705 [Candidatus Melainabacteria bacterium]|nr:hypothetical protein [Candidatus Melainabacteria bacterium]